MMLSLDRSILNSLTRHFRKFTTGVHLNHTAVEHESFLNGTSCVFIEELYRSWLIDPKSVHISWQTLFKLVHNNVPPGSAYHSPLTEMIKVVSYQPKAKIAPKVLPSTTAKIGPPKAIPSKATSPSTGKYGSVKEHLAVYAIIDSYRRRGHLLSDLDPLNLHRGPSVKKSAGPQNNLLFVNKVPPNMSAIYRLPTSCHLGGDKTDLSLKEILDRLDQVYCQTVGMELQHVTASRHKLHLNELVESPKYKINLSKAEKKLVLSRLCYAHNFEFFLSKKWPSEKRFGLEGCDVYIPAMRHLMEVASDHGAQYFVLGMAHRGRLNTLANVMEKPLTQLFAQFQPLDPDSMYGQGDVKYHAGSSTAVKHAFNDKPINISLCANPSHLESVNPIVTGKAAAEQTFLDDKNKIKVWPVLVHGDAAICGQGVVYETFHLSELVHFKTGGTIHIVINNQIGFTTDPYLSRSSEYCTAVAKVIEAPIFHVNADDVEAVMHISRIAADYRAKFKNDVVIDLVGYRRFGHNEVDEPMFTQPSMYKVIKAMKPVYFKYRDQLLAEKVVTESEVKEVEDDYFNQLEDAFQLAKKITKLNPNDWLSSPWQNFFIKGKDPLTLTPTGVKEEVLKKIGSAVTVPPPNFKIHKSLNRIYKNRKALLEKRLVDWSMGESFAFASVLNEGKFVRLSGQDVERGTFSHRHHVLHDQDNGNIVNVLKNIFPNQGKYDLCNSSLSEYGVLGFEFGMSLVNPHTLIMWEGQFGDFFNSAQVIIDQYLSSGQGKWYRHAGIVMLLPHGLEGMGPEHSSARPERFLISSNDDDADLNTNMPEQMRDANWFLVNCTTPANFFHVLRRQTMLNYRKPLVIFTPKSLLRHPKCISPLDSFLEGTHFQPYLPDPQVPPSDKITKLLLCTGKVYYELEEIRKKQKLENQIAIGRIEQLTPLPYSDILEDATKNYPKSRIIWVQEEHKNQGAWSYISPRLNRLLGRQKGAITYVGRLPSASPSTGHKLVYPREKEQLLFAAMNL